MGFNLPKMSSKLNSIFLESPQIPFTLTPPASSCATFQSLTLLSNVLSLYIPFVNYVETSVTVKPLCLLAQYSGFVFTCIVKCLCVHLYTKLALCTLVIDKNKKIK